MILSPESLAFEDIIQPYVERGTFRGLSFGQGPCGYDVRLDDVGALPGHRRTITPDGDGIVLQKGDSVLLPIMEHFTMPANVVGFVKDKSTWARQGLLVNQAVIEPGWSGHLSLRFTYHGDGDISIIEGEPVAQVVFQWLDKESCRPYSGKYQDQKRGTTGPRFEC